MAAVGSIADALIAVYPLSEKREVAVLGLADANSNEAEHRLEA